MTQQSHSQAYTLRIPKLKKIYVSHRSLQHYLQQLEHGSNLDVHQHLDEWVKKLWYIHTMEYYSAIKSNAFESVLMRWVNLEPIIQSEGSQKEKDKYHIIMHIYRIQKNSTEEFIYRAAMEKLEKAMAPHSSTLAWKIPWMEEPGGLQSMGLLRVGHD